MKTRFRILWLMVLVSFVGCSRNVGNTGQVYSFPVASVEATWIRNGEPIEFEGKRWYPQSDVEVFQDFEMLPLGAYRGVSFFAPKVDIRPYKRVYTKFGHNQFRYFLDESKL